MRERFYCLHLYRTILILFCSFTLSSANGFDLEPEFQGLNVKESKSFVTPIYQDAEYQSVINAYTLPLSRDFSWYTLPQSLDSSVGSITNQHFFINTRARLSKDLGRNFSFRWLYFAQRDREIDQERHFFILAHHLSPALSFEIYSEPSHQKSENDIGFALTLKSSLTLSHRIYYTHHDFTRAEHNSEADSFVGEDPISMGWTSLLLSPQLYAKLGFRFDKPVVWNLPQEGRLFKYEKTLIFSDFQVKAENNRTYSARLQFDQTYKGQSPLALSSIVAESWYLKRLLLRIATEFGAETDTIIYEPSLMYTTRLWTEQNGKQVIHQSAIPGVLARIRGPRHETGVDHFQIGLESSIFRAFGDLSLLPADQKHNRIESRLQTAYEFSFSNGANLLAAFNFDLDEWRSVPTFEGGNLQLHSDF